MKDLVGYIWGTSNLTYLYGDGSNETFYKSLPKFNGVPDVPFWLICFAAVVLVGVVVGCLCYAKRQLTIPKKQS
jgi:hypothetical protein